MHRWQLIAVACAIGVAAAGSVHAGKHSMRECTEGAEFIQNAARARDGGASREAFVARLEADLVTIRAFPPALRWFVQDEDDERFLRASVTLVYDQPLAPVRHRDVFLAACIDRIMASAATAG